MSLSDGDFLKWYNGEITRYRNIEWRIAGYSMAFSYAMILFAKNPITMTVIPNTRLLAVIVAAFALSLFLSELHVHDRLNDFRARRDTLLKAGNHLNATGGLLKGEWRDRVFLFGFLLFPMLTALLAFLVLWPCS